MSQAALRTFVAVPLPPPVKAALEDLSGRIRASGLHGRWVPSGNIHLTVAFLGETAVAAVKPMGEALAEAAGRCAAFHLTPVGLGVFPNLRRARVLWVGLSGDLEALADLTAAIYRGLTPLGWPNPARGATGHLTLVRAKGEFDPRHLAMLLDAHRTFSAPSFRVDSVVLYHSVLGSGPARYSPLTTAALGGVGTPAQTGGRP